MAVGAAVAGAVSDALGDPAAITRLPLTPERVRSLVATIQPNHHKETVTA
jgi:CO/xanthine dehydrogenase Mo-binding subunit